MFRRLLSRLRLRSGRAKIGRVDRESVERLVGFPIQDLTHYERALTHRSLLRSDPSPHLTSNERLEYLGDAVLGMLVAEHLFKQFPDKDEGYLTRLRAKLVNRRALAECALELELGEQILMSKAIAETTGRTSESILSDAFEAVIGAIYLDLGMETARLFVHKTVLHGVNLAELARQRVNFKSHLLEFAQARRWPQPDYHVVEEIGPSHDRTFRVEVQLSGRSLGEGTAKSKKEAEQIAASRALTALAEQDAAEGEDFP